MSPEVAAEAMRAYAEETNRLNRARRTNSDAWTAELAKVEKQIAQIIDAIADGMYHPSMKEKMTGLEIRKAELADMLSAVPQDIPDLLPAASSVYAQKVAALTEALNQPEERAHGNPPARAARPASSDDGRCDLMVDLKSGLEIEVLSAADAARRRQWREADKLRIVEESFRGSRVVSATARTHGISRSLLTTWRRQFREGTLGADRQPSFAPVLMASEVSSRAEPVSGADRIEIVLGNGRRLIVDPAIDPATLTRLVQVLDRA